MSASDKIIVSTEDATRLARTLEQFGGGRERDAVAALEEELARAEVLPAADLPHDVVTMNARVLFHDSLGRQREVTLVYPNEADAGRGHLSILSPIGSALLGLRVGQSITWPLPHARQRELTVVAVTRPD